MQFKIISTVKLPFFVALSLMAVLTSCGSFQYAGYDNDGIYSDDASYTEVEEPEATTSTNNSGYYKNYFAEKVAEIDAINAENEIFTDIDSYEGDYSERAQDNIEERPNHGGWGQNNNVTINYIDNGWNGWNNPWLWNRGFGYSYGWGQPWGWNSWGNNWGWNYGGGYYGWNSGWGYNNWGFNNNFYRNSNRYAYVNSRRNTSIYGNNLLSRRNNSALNRNYTSRRTTNSLSTNRRSSGVRSSNNASRSIRNTRVTRPSTRTRVNTPTRSTRSSTRTRANTPTRSTRSSTRTRVNTPTRSTRSPRAVRPSSSRSVKSSRSTRSSSRSRSSGTTKKRGRG